MSQFFGTPSIKIQPGPATAVMASGVAIMPAPAGQQVYASTGILPVPMSSPPAQGQTFVPVTMQGYAQAGQTAIYHPSGEMMPTAILTPQSLGSARLHFITPTNITMTPPYVTPSQPTPSLYHSQ